MCKPDKSLIIWEVYTSRQAAISSRCTACMTRSKVSSLGTHWAIRAGVWTLFHGSDTADTYRYNPLHHRDKWWERPWECHWVCACNVQRHVGHGRKRSKVLFPLEVFNKTKLTRILMRLPWPNYTFHIPPSTPHRHQLQQVATICKKGEAPPLLYFKHRYAKRVQTTISSLHPSLRRGRDSTPRYLAVQRISRPPHSTTLPSLRGHHKEKANDFTSLMHCRDTYSHRVNEIPPRQEQHKTGGYLRAFTLG